MNRRDFFATSALAGASALGATAAHAQAQPAPVGAAPAWPICLDTATIRPASLEEKVRIAAEAGYDAIEPWDGELREYEEKGGDLNELGKRIADAGLFVPSIIGLWDSVPPTQEQWDEQLPATRDRMRMASAIGAQHVQVVPAPGARKADFDVNWFAARYRDLIEIGLNDYQVSPALVFVQFLPACRTLAQASHIALATDHPAAKIIPDVFHMYIGDSGFNNLRHISGDFIAIFQFNDAPATPEKAQLKDEHRVFPGDGILPLTQCLRDLRDIGYTGCISLELYNPTYWERDLMDVAKEGLEKTKAVIAQV